MQIVSDEVLFLGFFLVIFITGWIFRGYYERKSPDAKKSLAELKKQPLQNESKESFTLLSLFGMVLLVALIIYVFYPSMFPWMQLPLGAIVRWIGVIIGIICVPFIGWILRSLGESFSKTLTIQKDHKLVTTGPYSRVRHPIYSVHTFWFLSFFLISTNLLFGICWILWLAYVIVRVPQEEKMLIEQFGEEYEEYMKRTGSLFPH